MKHTFITRSATAALAAALLGACSVSPEKLTKQDILNVVEHDTALIYEDQLPVTGELGLSDIMARALVYNLEHKTQRMAEAVSMGQFEMAKFDLLPALTGTMGYDSRSNVNASRSISVFNGNETLEPSTSQGQDQFVSDLTFSWNILDFGVSYFQAKQEADRFLASSESRKKVLLNLMHQARTVYWQALTAQQLEQPVEEAIAKAQQALADIDQGIANGIYPNPMQPLQLKRQLFEAMSELETLKETLVQAKVALASIINLPLSQFPKLKTPEFEALPAFDFNNEELELLALQNSTDVAEQIYSTRIERLESRKALLRLLPGVEIGYGLNYDNNEFLYNNDWSQASFKVTWNLMRLASTKQTLENADVREALAEQRRLAVSMAVITRLNLSLQKYQATQKRLVRAEQLEQIDQQISMHTSNSAAVSAANQIELIRTEVAALRTRMGYLQAYANSQEAYSSVIIALGLSPVPENYQLYTATALSEHIEQQLALWQSGDLNLVTMAAPVLEKEEG